MKEVVFFPLYYLGRAIPRLFKSLGEILIFISQIIRYAVKPPFRFKLILEQMEFIGVNSLFIILLAGAFTGMVFVFQVGQAFFKFNAETITGSVVAIALGRELAPVLSALMITGRAGSAMAAQIGTIRVTQQIDALVALRVEPINYLVVPRVIASICMFPIMTAIFDMVGMIGGYFVGVGLLQINKGAFITNIEWYVHSDDIMSGIIKAFFFGFISSAICCYKGYFTTQGTRGVGLSTTQAVVISFVSILISDYFLTVLLYKPH